jgi:hypothetical protein
MVSSRDSSILSQKAPIKWAFSTIRTYLVIVSLVLLAFHPVFHLGSDHTASHTHATFSSAHTGEINSECPLCSLRTVTLARNASSLTITDYSYSNLFQNSGALFPTTAAFYTADAPPRGPPTFVPTHT